MEVTLIVKMRMMSFISSTFSKSHYIINFGIYRMGQSQIHPENLMYVIFNKY